MLLLVANCDSSPCLVSCLVLGLLLFLLFFVFFSFAVAFHNGLPQWYDYWKRAIAALLVLYLIPATYVYQNSLGTRDETELVLLQFLTGSYALIVSISTSVVALAMYRRVRSAFLELDAANLDCSSTNARRHEEQTASLAQLKKYALKALVVTIVAAIATGATASVLFRPFVFCRHAYCFL